MTADRVRPGGSSGALPPLFGRVVQLDPAHHGELRLDRKAGHGFARHANAVPLSLVELPAAARHFPIVFADGPAPMPLAVLGYRNGENLFVSPDGEWKPGVYLPAYLRAFPFLFLQEAGGSLLHLGIEPDAPALHTGDGEPLFEDGQPTALLTEMLNFCKDLRASLLETQRFSQALAKAGLLERQEARVGFRDGGSARLDGFLTMSPSGFEALPDSTFLEWRQRHWLAPAYATLHASGAWNVLLSLAEARRA